MKLFKKEFVNNYNHDIEILYDVANLSLELNINKINEILVKYKDAISSNKNASIEIKDVIKDITKQTINNLSPIYINHMYQYFSEDGLINMIYLFLSNRINNYISSSR